jgi:hypothetical protein
MGYKLETIALISIENYNAFRIRCIMLILEIFKNEEIRNHHSLILILAILWGIQWMFQLSN